MESRDWFIVILLITVIGLAVLLGIKNANEDYDKFKVWCTNEYKDTKKDVEKYCYYMYTGKVR